MERSYYEQGLVKIKAGDFQGAIESLSCAIREEPENPSVYYQRGLGLFELRDQQGAIADYTKALELDPQYFEAYLARAIAAVKTLKIADPDSEEFSDAIAELHVCATVLEPYSEGMRESIDRYTEDLPEDHP